MAKQGIEKAFNIVKSLPRVTIGNLKPLPDTHVKHNKPRGQHTGKRAFRGTKGQHRRGTLPRWGFEGNATPFYLKCPKEPYYEGHHMRREYPPLSLHQLQRMIDLGRIDVSQPIDLSSLCNTKLFRLDTDASNHYGVNLTDEGADIFDAKVNIEVQWASELTIATIERNGGVITTKYLDPPCVLAMADPLRFFKKGRPIPRCKLPPDDALEFYTDAKNRGYLADPDKVAEAREELAQKYGYALPDLSKDASLEMLSTRKDPRQIWFGLEPGWVVNLRDKTILKPTNEELIEYYKS